MFSLKIPILIVFKAMSLMSIYALCSIMHQLSDVDGVLEFTSLGLNSQKQVASTNRIIWQSAS